MIGYLLYTFQHHQLFGQNQYVQNYIRVFSFERKGYVFVNFCFRDSYYLRRFFHVRDKVHKFIQVLF